jgi:hypothetical protein
LRHGGYVIAFLVALNDHIELSWQDVILASILNRRSG